MGKHKAQRASFAQILEQSKQQSKQRESALAPLFAQSLEGLPIEGESKQQLDCARSLEGMKAVFAFPDLHPGKGIPIGVACASQGVFYPHLAGSDLGCGVLLCKLRFKKPVSPDKLSKPEYLGAGGYPEHWREKLGELAARHKNAAGRWGDFAGSLRSLGGGNHFAEIGVCSQASGQGPFEEGEHALLVHTGSRLMGERMGWAWAQAWGGKPARAGSAEAQAWLEDQAYAIEWARLNRWLCALSIAQSAAAEAEAVADVWHNGIAMEDPGAGGDWPQWADPSAGPIWVCRKGASCDGPLVPLPASRGEESALLMGGLAPFEATAGSLAHGAGRKWKRSECKARLEGRFALRDLERTEMGSVVISSDPELLWQEAPMAYKSAKAGIMAMEKAGFAKELAKFRPLATIKR